MLGKSIFVLFMITFPGTYCQDVNIDINGYIVYCPCMGRFGNQADHFLGALGFAKALNRTLVLPPWVEYRTGETRSIQVPFNTYFFVEPVKQCHKAILMEDFMRDIAPKLWPPEERVSFCYSSRGNDSCKAKEGNPFGPFWDTYKIDFVRSEFYGPLHYDVYHTDVKLKWRQKYTAAEWPVLAFTGAPASFPVQLENRDFHACLDWNEDIQKKARAFIKGTLPKGGFIGIHLRNGLDWVRACNFISTTPNLFAAPQCLGYRNERGKATSSMCLPTLEVIVRDLKRIIRGNNDIKSVFVASDNNHMLEELGEALMRIKIRVFRQKQPASPHLDLAILGQSNYFIGNCISSFSAFVARARRVRFLPTYFWGFPSKESLSSHALPHQEL